MKFEYDSEKSRKNKEKHGIDFEEAKEIWNDKVYEIPQKYEHENRILVIGKILEIFWSAIITYRQAVTRLISVRRSREKERIVYENQFSKED